ncbi:MAG TPA: hypothetical protein VK034_04205 [Enhygromyxa sp.]|nr:hypothetical protein [Enhygromyxa sp.]
MRLRSLALVLALPLGGCAWLFPNDEGGDGGPPCEDDINGCDDNTSNFMEDPSCPLQGELELELGEGELEFSALAPGELPEIHSGLQGGQHVWMAVRVKNPDPDRKQLKIRIKADYCDANCEVVGNWTTDNLRELVADETTLRITPEGWFEQTRMLVTVFDWVGTTEQRIEMLVTDPCGRQGLVTAGPS